MHEVPSSAVIISRPRRGRTRASLLWAAVAAFCMAVAPALAVESECEILKNSSSRKLLAALRTMDSQNLDCVMGEELVARVVDRLSQVADPYAEHFNAEAFRNLQRDLRGSDRDAVTYRLLPNARAYVRIHSFNERVPKQLIEALQHLARDAPGSLRGLVLDLRDNPGGLVRSAVGVAAVFLPSDALVVSTDGEGPDSKLEMRAHPDDYLIMDQEDYLAEVPAQIKILPITVLVNKGSASASEILAAALQDHGRAVIVGTKTYGKGSVQTIIPLPDDTAVKFTTAYFYTPNGRRVEGQGVSPDVLIARSARLGADKGEGLSVPAQSTAPTRASACVLKLQTMTPVTLDTSQWPGRDKEDCQLQQAMLVLNYERVAKAGVHVLKGAH